VPTNTSRREICLTADFADVIDWEKTLRSHGFVFHRRPRTGRRWEFTTKYAKHAKVGEKRRQEIFFGRFIRSPKVSAMEPKC
jgi:hypothetical protein